MRIGLALDHFDPRRGGVEHWTYQLADRLLQLGHEVHVVAGGFKPHTGCSNESDQRPKVIEHRLAANQSRVARAAAAEQILRRLELDVVHDMGIGWFCDVFQPHGGSRLASFEQNLLLLPRWLRVSRMKYSSASPQRRLR